MKIYSLNRNVLGNCQKTKISTTWKLNTPNFQPTNISAFTVFPVSFNPHSIAVSNELSFPLTDNLVIHMVIMIWCIGYIPGFPLMFCSHTAYDREIASKEWPLCANNFTYKFTFCCSLVLSICHIALVLYFIDLQCTVIIAGLVTL